MKGEMGDFCLHLGSGRLMACHCQTESIEYVVMNEAGREGPEQEIQAKGSLGMDLPGTLLPDVLLEHVDGIAPG